MRALLIVLCVGSLVVSIILLLNKVQWPWIAGLSIIGVVTGFVALGMQLEDVAADLREIKKQLGNK